MKPVSLTQLRADTRLFANQRSTALVTDAELDRLLNLRLAALYDLFLEAGGHERYEQTATLSTTAGNQYVALPADFYELLTVIARWGAQDLEELDSLDHLGDQVQYRNFNTWAQFAPKAWRAQRTPPLLEFFPTPNTVTTLEIRYVQVYPTLSDPAQTFDGVNGWEVMVSAGAAMDLLGLQGMPIGYAERLYAEAKDRIEGLAARRAAANPPTIRDVRGSVGRDSWWRRIRAVP